MKLDAQTLFFSMWVTVTLTGAALLLGVNWRNGRGIRAWGAALWLQAIGWATLMAAYQAWPRELATVGAVAIVGSISCMYVAACSYLGRPVSRAWVWGPPAVTAVVHWLVFQHFAARIALVNGILGVQMLWLAWLLLKPGHATGWRWRWLAGIGLACSGPLVLGRMAMAVFWPEQYPAFDADHWLNVLGLVFNNACLTIGTLAFLLAHRDEAERELKRLATIDGHTGLLNRRTLMQRAEVQVQLAHRHHHPLAVVMFDIDHFKQINDRHGHPVGDRVIEAFAKALMKTARTTDLIGRYGGEEFCLVMPMSGLDAVQAIDQRMREQLAMEVNALVGFEVNFSAGAAVLGRVESLEGAISRADESLYEAKRSGRGRLSLAPDHFAARRA